MEIIQLKTSDQYDISTTVLNPKFGAEPLINWQLS